MSVVNVTTHEFRRYAFENHRQYKIIACAILDSNSARKTKEVKTTTATAATTAKPFTLFEMTNRTIEAESAIAFPVENGG